MHTVTVTDWLFRPSEFYPPKPLDTVTVPCTCGWGGEGTCPCPNNPAYQAKLPEVAIIPSNWKPRIRVKAISKRW